jgi:hypothetical protein
MGQRCNAADRPISAQREPFEIVNRFLKAGTQYGKPLDHGHPQKPANRHDA